MQNLPGTTSTNGPEVASPTGAGNTSSKAGLDADWQAVVADVRARHFRKKGFMVGFEDIVSGAPRLGEPPFLERAKARWPRKPKGR